MYVMIFHPTEREVVKSQYKSLLQFCPYCQSLVRNRTSTGTCLFMLEFIKASVEEKSMFVLCGEVH